MYAIEYAVGVADDLADLRAFDRATILDRIEEQLSNEPATETRNKSVVIGLESPWEHETPIWQLRVGAFRVFYDVDESASRVVVRAIRHKPPHRTTEEIL